jgi:hypothetical protein
MVALRVLAILGAMSSTLAATTPELTHIFSAKLNVGRPLDPIPLLQGGTRTIEPLINGTVTGPLINGTIIAGFAAPITAAGNNITGKTPVQLPQIYFYGITCDGTPFYAHEEGIGPIAGQNTRVVLEIGGRYSALQSLYILAQPTINAARNVVTVEGYSIAPPVSG